MHQLSSDFEIVNEKNEVVIFQHKEYTVFNFIFCRKTFILLT